jgi:ATP adenylyltransferase
VAKPSYDGCVANQRIWAPWRLKYVKGAKDDADGGCIFCARLGESTEHDRENLIVHRGERCFVILNKFPYTNGHVMVAPYAHLATLPDLDAETVAEMMALAQKAITVLDEVYGPQGYNAGLNQGRIAGAGYADHIHLHVVPRWAGDTNYMPVLADTRVMPQSLEDSYDSLVGKF